MFAEASKFNSNLKDWDTSSAFIFVSQRMHGDVPESEQHQPSDVLHVTVFVL